MNRKLIMSVLCAVGVTGAAFADTSLNDVRTDVVPGEWTSSFNAARSYAEQNGVPLVMFWSNHGCAQCNKMKTAANSAEFVTWRQTRKYIMVFCENNEEARVWTKNDSGLFPYMRVYWPAGGVDVRFTGRIARIPGSSTVLQTKFIKYVDGLLAAWISGGGNAGSGTIVGPGDGSGTSTPSAPVVGSEWKKARKLIGALYNPEGRLAGRVVVTAGKASAAKKSRIKASIMTQDGRSRSIPGKLFAIDATTKGTISSAKGTLAFAITSAGVTGEAVVDGVTYTVTSDVTGGSLTGGTYTFALESAPEKCQDYPVIMPNTLLPFNVPFTATAKKWTFTRKSLSLKYDNSVKDFVATKVANPSGLKLSYKSTNGYFKGSFSVYTRNGVKMKRYTATVTGFMLRDKGYGVATIKKVGTFPCKIVFGTVE